MMCGRNGSRGRVIRNGVPARVDVERLGGRRRKIRKSEIAVVALRILTAGEVCWVGWYRVGAAFRGWAELQPGREDGGSGRAGAWDEQLAHRRQLLPAVRPAGEERSAGPRDGLVSVGIGEAGSGVTPKLEPRRQRQEGWLVGQHLGSRLVMKVGGGGFVGQW